MQNKVLVTLDELIDMIQKEHDSIVEETYTRQRLYNYLRALKFLKGKYNKNSEILKIVKKYSANKS